MKRDETLGARVLHRKDRKDITRADVEEILSAFPEAVYLQVGVKNAAVVESTLTQLGSSVKWGVSRGVLSNEILAWLVPPPNGLYFHESLSTDAGEKQNEQEPGVSFSKPKSRRKYYDEKTAAVLESEVSSNLSREGSVEEVIKYYRRKKLRLSPAQVRRAKAGVNKLGVVRARRIE